MMSRFPDACLRPFVMINLLVLFVFLLSEVKIGKSFKAFVVVLNEKSTLHPRNSLTSWGMSVVNQVDNVTENGTTLSGGIMVVNKTEVGYWSESGTAVSSDVMPVHTNQVVNVTENGTATDFKSGFNVTRNATIVLYLHGEMGNHLYVLALGLAMKLLAAEQYGISSELVLRHQVNAGAKWIRARDNVKQCFPKLRRFDFSAANTQAFDKLEREQDEQLQTHQLDLSSWRSMLLESPRLTAAGPVYFPFLKVKGHCGNHLLDQYLDQIRSFLEFDRAACCLSLPEPDKTVFVSTLRVSVVLVLFQCLNNWFVAFLIHLASSKLFGGNAKTRETERL